MTDLEIDWSNAHNTGSHMPVLRWAWRVLDGFFGEFGGGAYSTDFLARQGRADHRLTFSVEKDPAWYDYIERKYPPEDFTRFYLLDAEPRRDTGLDPAFLLIDNGEGEDWQAQRLEEAQRWREVTDTIAIHDAPPGTYPEEALDAWKERFYFAPANGGPFTLVLLRDKWHSTTALRDGEVVIL